MDKDEVRTAAWQRLEDAEVARFPGTRGRIPNFVGAEAAADRLRDLDVWKAARALKVNPDSPQRPVRHRALRDGKRVVVPVPRLAGETPFLLLDPERIPENKHWEASSIAGAERWGVPTASADVPPLDLVVTGCVAVTADGARCGKGGGYSDLEFAMLIELGLVDADTPIVTTVHDVQEVPSGTFDVEAHDITLDAWCTPTRTVHCPDRPPRPPGVLWDRLDEARIDAIPVLASRAPGRS